MANPSVCVGYSLWSNTISRSHMVALHNFLLPSNMKKKLCNYWTGLQFNCTLKQERKKKGGGEKDLFKFI